MKIKVMAIILSIASELLAGENARLIAVAPVTDVKPHDSVKLDVYLYNPNSRSVTAPTLEFISARLSMSDASGKRTAGEAEVQGQTSTHPPPPQSLGPNRVQRRTTDVQINAKEGDLIEISLEIGDKKKLRSNPLLLFCTREGKGH